MARAIAIVLVLLSSTPIAALAQAVAILSPKVDPQVTPAEAKATLERIAEHLREQGFTAIEPVAVQHKLSARLRGCADPGCARDALELLGADLALLVALFPASDAPDPNVSLELIDKAGVSYAGSATAHSDEPPLIATLDDAIARQRRGPGPWLTIEGEPQGADIFINGKPVGELPRYTGRVDPGMAHVIVREPGFKELNTLVDVGSSLDASKVIDVKLDPAPLPSLATPIAIRGAEASDPHSLDNRAALDADDAGRSRSERRATAADYVLGGTLAVGGLLLATIDPIQTAAKSGQCADADCRTLYAFSTRSTVEVASGTALVLLGAALTFWWKPFSVRVTTRDRTCITLQADF